jgi:3-methyladenine DNA glycosylase AlkD
MRPKAGGKPAAKTATAKRPATTAKPAAAADVPQLRRAAMRMLEEKSTQKDRDNLARFGIAATKPFGVSMSNLQAIAKSLGRNHELAEALWQTGRYEARMLATLVDQPSLVTSAQMERWCREFDNWGICDTACFFLFDRTPHAWGKVTKWAGRREEFIKRAAFALLASLAVHDKKSGDGPFLDAMPLIEQAATDERNFVKKGVSWALRVTGRRSPALNKAAIGVSRRLAASTDTSARWIGKGALRELTGPVVVRALARK